MTEHSALHELATDGRKRRLALWGYGVATLALVPAFIAFAAPDGALGGASLVLVAGLIALSAIAYGSEVALRSSVPVTFDASVVAALLALQIAGPLVAFLVLMIPDIVDRLVLRRGAVFTPGLLANVAGAGWAVLAGDALLSMAGRPELPTAVPALFTAGIGLTVTTFVVGRLLYGRFYQGLALSETVRAEFLPLLPAMLGMLAVAALVGAAIPLVGPFALIGFAAAIALPQLALRLATPRGSVAALERGTAAAMFAAMLADEIALDRRERRVLAAAAQSRFSSPETMRAFACVRDGDLSGVFIALLHAEERWDGTGQPGRIAGLGIPLASRILAVAEAWARLTAQGGVRLSHTEALLDLAARAGSELDPQLVEAAGRAITRERAMPGPAAFEPRLHRLPLPRPVRRALPHVAARLAPGAPVL